MTEDTPHILVVDDDKRLRKLLRGFLTKEGFLVTTACDAAEARRTLLSFAFDLIVLDVMMPGESGLELTKSLRKTSTIPILLLTAMSETADRISGLEHGADDYLAKPFEPRELLLRIGSILRRAPASGAKGPTGVSMGLCRYDPTREELFREGESVRLSSAELALLKIFAAHPGEVLSRDALGRQTGASANLRTIDVQITRLRRKIEPDTQNPRYLQTIRGQGYVLRTD